MSPSDNMGEPQNNGARSLTETRRGRWWKFSTWWPVLLLLGLTGMIACYRYRTAIPPTMTIAGGPRSGRYAAIASVLAEEIERRLRISVSIRTTQGSLENLRLLGRHEADLGFYQPQTGNILNPDADRRLDALSTSPAAHVSNLYPEFLVPVASIRRTETHLTGLIDGVWSCNDSQSGDHAIARLLMRHLDIESDANLQFINYPELPAALKNGNADVAVLCCGLDARILRDVLQPDVGRLVTVPAAGALGRKYSHLTQDTIPQGYLQVSPMIPSEDFTTVTTQAQLLAADDAPVRLIEEITRIIMDPAFQRRAGLTDLADRGISYATASEEFPLHTGASHVFYPELKPLLNPDFVEGTEGLRSFAVSLIAAIWLINRWWTQRRIRSQEHRLDRSIRKLLQLERDQLTIDGDGRAGDAASLQQMLDQVTFLRQDVLREFTAHELNEDRAVECFLQMCHALSDKINAKLTRNCLLHSARGEPES
ncbi:MAG: TAXI family TRAP transporter solute-binding subunit [Planctomycetaceae bacterium]